MKKAISFVLLVAIFFPLVACSPKEAPDGGTIEQVTAKPFSMEYDYSESRIKSLTENDDLITIGEAGPFYAGNAQYEQPLLKKFQALKIAFVNDVMKNVEQLNLDSKAYAVKLKEVKDKYVDVLGQTLEQNKKLGKQMKEVAKGMIAPEVHYTANFVVFDSIGTDSTNPAASALMKFQKTYLSLSTASLLTEDTANTVGGIMTLQTALQNSSDAALQGIAGSIESDFSASVNTLGEMLASLQEKAQAIGTQLKQIESAEYYLGMASVQYIDENMVTLQPMVDGLAPNANLTADDVAFIKELTANFKDLTATIKEELDAVDKNELLTYVPQNDPLIPLVYAEESGYGGQALGILSSIGKSAFQGAKTIGKFTWETAKTSYNAATTVAGVTVDTLGAHTKSAADVIYGVANGNTVGEITSEIGKNYTKVGENFKAGKSGSETMKTATGYFEGAEEAGGQAASAVVEKTLGKGWTSWVAGHAGKLTVNLFTSLGKGITKVANTQSTQGEVAEGVLDIGMSFIGGSKVIASGSQVKTAAKEGLKNLGEKGLNFLGQTVFKGDLKALKGMSAEILANTKLTPAQVEQLLSNAINIEVKEGIEKELVAASAKINQKFLELFKSGAKTIGENATAGAREAYKEFVEQTFESSLKGLGDSLVAVLGKDFKTYVDNLIANKADDLIKEITKNLIDKGVIPGIPTAPDLKDLAGTWGEGFMTITDIYVAEELKKSPSNPEGCDVSELEAKKGVKQSLEISLQPDSESGGMMTIKMAGDDAKAIPFTYADGVITASLSQDKATVSVNMSVSQEGESFKANGGLEVNYLNGGVKIKADSGASKSVPKPPAPAPQE